MTDPVDAFRAQYGEALAQAETFSRRAEKQIPADRWASEREMHLVAKGIRAQQRIIAMQTDVILGLLSEIGGDDGGSNSD